MSFLEYSGKNRKRGEQYIFKMKNGKNFTSKYSTSIFNPTYDNSFKNMFCSRKAIIKSLVNSVIFPESKLIEKVEYSKTNFDGKMPIKRKYSIGSKSFDVGCKCFLKKNNNLNIKDNILMCDIEMQIGFSDSTENRFIDDVNQIRVDSNHSDSWIISFILKENIDGNNVIKLNKINTGSGFCIKNYEPVKLIEISLNHCLSLIEQNKDIKIINGEKLGLFGKEWIKFLSIPIWCDSDAFNENVYILPKHTRKNFISCSFIKKAIDQIIYKRQAFDLSQVDEHYNREERKRYFRLAKENEELKQKLKRYEEMENEDNDSANDYNEEVDEDDDEDENDFEEDEDIKDDSD